MTNDTTVDPRPLKWYQKLRTYIAPPIEPGSRWALKDERGNLRVQTQWVVEVEDVECKWVRYRYINPSTGYRATTLNGDTTHGFRAAFRPLP